MACGPFAETMTQGVLPSYPVGTTMSPPSSVGTARAKSGEVCICRPLYILSSLNSFACCVLATLEPLGSAPEDNNEGRQEPSLVSRPQSSNGPPSLPLPLTPSRPRYKAIVHTILDPNPTPWQAPYFELIHNEFSNPMVVSLPLRLDVHGQDERLTLEMFSNVVRFYSDWRLKLETKVSVLYEGQAMGETQTESLLQTAGPDKLRKDRCWVYDYQVAATLWSSICQVNRELLDLLWACVTLIIPR